MVSRAKVGWAAAAARTGSDRRARARCRRTVGALLSLGSPSKSGRGPDPAKGAAFITLLGKRVPSHCHPSRGARQPMGTQREVRKAGGGGGEGGSLEPSSRAVGDPTQSPYFLDRARTFRGFLDDHTNSLLTPGF